MKTVASATLAAALVGVVAAQSAAPTVTTPTSLVVCQPAQFTVSGGTAPYFITILPGGETGATPLENLPEQSAAGSITWTVDLPAGQSVTIAVKDSTGAQNYSQQVTIQSGTSTSCLGANSTNGGGVSSGSAASSAATSASSAASSRSSASATSSSPASSAASSSSSSRASSSSSSQASQTSQQASSSSAAPSPSSSNSGADKVTTGVLGFVAAAVMALVA